MVRRYRREVPVTSASVSPPTMLNTTYTKVTGAISVYETIMRLVAQGRDQWRNHFTYTVEVSEQDSLYEDVLEWLTKVLPNEKHRALSVSSVRATRPDYAYASDSDEREKKAPPLKVRYSSTTTRPIVIEGNRIQVTVEEPPESAAMVSRTVYSKVLFTASSHEGQQAVVRRLQEMNESRATTRKANLKMVGNWGDWTTRSDLPARTMESVSLPVDQKNRIREDLSTFLASEEKYNRLAIPWHRGYMFYGPPGTGKTSLVKALANEFNLDLWYISLSDLKAESGLLSLISGVGPRSLLLLEDIDTISITHDRDSSDQGTISMGSLLNTLDGVATPHGLITVMTTNRFELLDPALTRAGRMDLIEKLDYPDLTIVTDLFQHFYGETPKWTGTGVTAKVVKDNPVAASQISEAMKRHLDNPTAARNAIVDMYKTQKAA